MKKFLFTLLTTTMSVIAMAQTQAPAFPGAEGHGRYVTGGHGGKIIHVTNLNDSGTGSLRAAVNGTAKKIIVFDVGGVIALNSDLNIGANTTILGQTAPYPGITLRYYNVNPHGNNIVMRFIRIRRGQERNVNDGADASTARNYTGIMLDHCSFSWSIDEVASFYDNNNFTMQWCTIGESLVNAGHGKGAHGYGGIWGGKLASFHHNLLIHHGNRTPRFNGARYRWTGYTGNQLYNEYKWENYVQAENVDLRNCVIYNCGNGCYGGPGGGYINMVGNFYKTGPAATTSRLTTVTVGASGNSTEGDLVGMTSRYYLEGNLINNNAAGWSNMSYDNGTFTIDGKPCCADPTHYYGEGVTYYKNPAGTDCVRIESEQAVPTGEVTTHTANNAYEKVLTYSGASLNQDDVDARYFSEARNGTATYTGSVTNTKGRIDLVSDVNGYTEANFPTGSREAGFDSDNDGIPDAWETANGLNPNNASDAQTYTLDEKGWYTNLEVYANSIVQDIMIAENKDAESSFKEYYPGYTKEDGTVVPAINNGKELDGNITWSYNDGTVNQTPTLSTDFTGALSTTVTIGSNLTSNGIITTNSGITLTSFACNSKDTEPGDQNAVTFSITPAQGYAFQPTDVAFKVSRSETSSYSGGTFSAYWLSSDGSKKSIIGATLAERKSRQPYITEVAEGVNGVDASSTTSSLVINLYNFATSMPMGITDIVINGRLSMTGTSISTPSIVTNHQGAIYNLAGQKVDASYKGIVIRNGKKFINK